MENAIKEPNPCLSCGACCAAFRISFYWAEADGASGGKVPEAYTEKLNQHRLTLKGTNSSKPYCLALKGVIGSKVYCEIYENRPSPCREFKLSCENGEKSLKCDQARAVWGLPAITG